MTSFDCITDPKRNENEVVLSAVGKIMLGKTKCINGRPLRSTINFRIGPDDNNNPHCNRNSKIDGNHVKF